MSTPSKSHQRLPHGDLCLVCGTVALMALAAVKQSVFWWAMIAGAGAGAWLVWRFWGIFNFFLFFFAFLYAGLFRAEMKKSNDVSLRSLVA